MYRVFCAILGDSNRQNAFPIEMNQDQTVGDLRRKLNVALGRFEADDLKLYHVNINLLVTDDTYESVVESITQRTTKLKNSFRKLSHMKVGIPDDCIHILVDPPAGESFSSLRLYSR